MKRSLLLYLARTEYRPRTAVAATLAWLAARQGQLFEVYYDAFRAGQHYGGGNPAEMPPGVLSGGPISGAHHLEELYLLLHSFETTAVTSGRVAFTGMLEALHVPTLSTCAEAVPLLLAAYRAADLPLPGEAILLDGCPRPDLVGIDAYYAPEVYYGEALGLEASLADAELAALHAAGVRTVRAYGVAPEALRRWEAHGFTVVEGDPLLPSDNYRTVTARIGRRWAERCRGWVVADPEVVASWLPRMQREDRIAIYSRPQGGVLEDLREQVLSTPVEAAVLGRQYHDSDFFKLSEMGQAFQVIDPARPPFPVIAEADHAWPDVPGPEAEEPSDEQLRAYAREGRVLTSLVFWSGMIREVENLYRLMDLAALTGLKAGVVLTLQSFEAMRHPPLTLMTVPRDQGGVYPQLEPILGSCGVGVSIESLMPAGTLEAELREAHTRLRTLLPAAWQPRGWWGTMDAMMLPADRHPRGGVEVSRYAPHVRLRFPPSGTSVTELAAHEQASAPSAIATEREAPAPTTGQPQTSLRRRLRGLARRYGVEALLEPYRPYEFCRPGPMAETIIPAVKAGGCSYLFSKSGFGQPPRVLYQDDDLIALNYTAGRWDGWTPFETINHADDVRRAEKVLLARGRPGWLVSTIDTCLWAFAGNVWDRGVGLLRIADLVARGGASGQLINVTPHVVARYARLLREMGLCD